MTITTIIILVTLLATGFAWVELLVRAGQVRRLTADLAASHFELEDMRAAVAVTERTCGELREQLTAQAQQADRMRERLDQLELRDPETGTYVQAIRLIRRGADAGTLVADCGLTRAEAELLIALHGRNDDVEGGAVTHTGCG